MSLSDRLVEYVRACFTGLYVQSFEHDDALLEIAQLCRREDWQLAAWDVDRGLQIGDQKLDLAGAGNTDPLAAIRTISSLSTPGGSTLLVLVNFHRFLGSPEVVQALAHQITCGKQDRTFVLILAPVVQIPVELERLLMVIDHELPGRQQLEGIARGVGTEPGELPDGSDLDLLLDASAGLTRLEAENAFSLSLVRQGRLAQETIWELKSQALKQSGLLHLHRAEESFSDLGGLDALKSFCTGCLGPRQNDLVRPRGVLLLGVPGTGKSAFAKALGKETNRPTLVLDVGSLMGSLVGQSEQQTRQALRIVDAMAPAVLFVDEVEKGLSGAASSGTTDSGVAARIFGTILTWLSDHQSDVFVICTANDVSRLPPEFTRAERLDAIFFLDLPSEHQREAIWKLYLDKFQLDAGQPKPPDENWSGAEIRACCRLAALLDISVLQASTNIVPISVTAAESVDHLRSWASGRCLSAERPGVYLCAVRRTKAARKISRDVSNN